MEKWWTFVLETPFCNPPEAHSSGQRLKLPHSGGGFQPAPSTAPEFRNAESDTPHGRRKPSNDTGNRQVSVPAAGRVRGIEVGIILPGVPPGSARSGR